MIQSNVDRVEAAELLRQSDAGHVMRLVELGGDPAFITAIQSRATRTMAQMGYVYPSKSCAATLSHLLREAGIDVRITTGAQKLADRLRVNRGWYRVEIPQQQPGDVGVCRSIASDVPGADHIYLVIERINQDLMLVVDNQAQGRTHERHVSGKGGKTPTHYFLRAVSPGDFSPTLNEFDQTSEVPDEPTADVPEPYMDDGSPSLLNDDGSIRIVE